MALRLAAMPEFAVSFIALLVVVVCPVLKLITWHAFNRGLAPPAIEKVRGNPD